MPTSWAERTAVDGGFQEGRAYGDGTDDYFIDVLFEGTGFFAVPPWSGTERSAPSTSSTERTAPAPSWTERTA